MRLRDFDNLCRTASSNADAKFMIKVLVDEPDCEIKDCEVFCTIQGNYKTELYLKTEILDSEIQQIYALDLDEFMVVIDRRTGNEIQSDKV